MKLNMRHDPDTKGFRWSFIKLNLFFFVKSTKKCNKFLFNLNEKNISINFIVAFILSSAIINIIKTESYNRFCCNAFEKRGQKRKI